MREEPVKFKKGFTLVELIVTLVILSVVAAIAVPSFLGFIDRGRAKECVAVREALASRYVSAQLRDESLNLAEYTVSSGDLTCPSKGIYTVEGYTIHCSIEGHGEVVCSPGNTLTWNVDLTVDNGNQTDAPRPEPEPTEPQEPETEPTEPTEPETTPKEDGDASISLDKSSMLLRRGRDVDNSMLNAALSGDTSGAWVEWSVAPAGIVEIKQHNSGDLWGHNTACGINPIAVGTCLVTATLRGTGISSSCQITVYAMLDGLGLTDTYKKMYTGETYQMIPTYNPVDATYREVTYSSENPEIATVDAKGLVTAHKAGNVTMICRSEQPNGDPPREMKLSIDVLQAYPTQAHIEPQLVNLYLDVEEQRSVQLSVEADQPAMGNVPVEVTGWNSSNWNVASVNNMGVVTAVGEGSCVITANVRSGDYGNSTITPQRIVSVSRKEEILDVIPEDDDGAIGFEASPWSDLKLILEDSGWWNSLFGGTRSQSHIYFDSKGNAYVLKKRPQNFLPFKTNVSSLDEFIEENSGLLRNWKSALTPINGTKNEQGKMEYKAKKIGEKNIAQGDIVWFTDSNNKKRYYVITESPGAWTWTTITEDNVSKNGVEISPK